MSVYRGNIGLYKNIDPLDSKPYVFIETYKTMDGTRTRIMDGRWASEEEAAASWFQRCVALHG